MLVWKIFFKDQFCSKQRQGLKGLEVHLYPNFLWVPFPPPPPTGVKANKENTKAKDNKLRAFKKIKEQV